MHHYAPCHTELVLRNLCPESEQNPLPKLYHLRRVEGQNFGFYLQRVTEKQGLEITDVDPWSPAEHSGLKVGDRVLEVNDDYVVNMNFIKVRVLIPPQAQNVMSAIHPIEGWSKQKPLSSLY